VVDNVPAVTDEDGRPFAELFVAACVDASKNERQCLIVARHYGLDGDGWQSLAAVAASLDRPVQGSGLARSSTTPSSV
jgi:hypothetical protein